LDRESNNEAERLLARIGAPIVKYWNCKRTPAVVAEAVECHGGNGFIEDHLLARLYREAPLNGIWEGTGNVICLDVLRSMTREPDCIPALFDELETAAGADRTYDAAVATLKDELANLRKHEGQAQRLVERIALLLSASLLLRHAPHEVADAFIATRLAGGWAGQFGDLSANLDAARIARRAVPEITAAY
jgi:putative acyl-CoA dehydrogenase